MPRFIIVGYERQILGKGAFLPTHPWAAPKKPTLNMVKKFKIFIVVCYTATWTTFKPNPEKILKNPPWKKFLYFRKWKFLAPKQLNKPFSNFLTPKNVIKLFHTVNRTSLGETGCLSNLYYLLTARASSFLICHPFSNTVS